MIKKEIVPKQRGVIMKSLSKIFLLTVLGLGVYVTEVFSNDDIQSKIHNIVQTKISSLAGTAPSNDNAALVKILEEIKVDLLEVLSTAPDTEQYKKLQTAIKNLNTKNMLVMVGHVRIILANLDEKTKNLILDHVPAKIKPFITQ